jgi:2-keto-3-deoxy-L-rhamnonate aldolase RhmA
MKISLSDFASPFLTSASAAESVCAEIFAHWDFAPVTLDFSHTRTITPSFANTLMMNLLHRVPPEDLNSRVRFEGTSAHIDQAIDRAIQRHSRLGISLSDYMPA